MVERVKKLLQIEQLSSSQFADEIKLQRSSLSHVLSGRNKPSLDFVMKIKQRFSEVSLDWLIFGTGPMFLVPEGKKENKTPISNSEILFDNLQNEIEFESKPETTPQPKQVENDSLKSHNDSNVDNPKSADSKKVIIFYNDGTFDEFVSR